MSDARSEVLDRIRQSLKQAYLPATTETSPLAPTPPSFDRPLPEVFAKALRAVQGRVYEMDSMDEARDFLLSEFEQRQINRLLCWEPGIIGIPGLAEGLRSQGIEITPSRLDSPMRQASLTDLAEIEVGLTGAAAGLARTGTLVLHSDRYHGRLASLMPPVHYAVLRASQIYADIGDWIRAAGVADRIAESSNTVLITGPSRSADIAQTLTLGAHGPKEVHVALIR
ncbi:MAG: lactate utilization protein [Caldilineales bacterium]|nr:lactate utilization protein [Caldilineales bacterium]